MIEPKTYRKKPVHVKAMQLTDSLKSHNDILVWVNGSGGDAYTPVLDPGISIKTLEGTMNADIGDYIIRGVAGEFYPCKPGIFAATYEEVDQDGNRTSSTQYPESELTPTMTVAAILEWLEGEKEDIESGRKSIEASHGALGTMTTNLQVGVVENLIDKLTKSTFEQMDEAQHDD